MGETSPAWSRTLQVETSEGYTFIQEGHRPGLTKFTCTQAHTDRQLRVASQACRKGPSSHFPGHSPAEFGLMHLCSSYLVRRDTPSRRARASSRLVHTLQVISSSIHFLAMHLPSSNYRTESKILAKETKHKINTNKKKETPNQNNSNSTADPEKS